MESQLDINRELSGQRPKGEIINELFSKSASPADGITILSAVMNRSENLLRALPSWLASSASRIIVVDYSSSASVRTEIADQGLADERLTLIRVDGKKRWHLSEAFNSGLSQVQSGFVLKLDGDIVLEDPSLGFLSREKSIFMTGSWAHRKAGQEFTNGSLFVHVYHLKVVGGWDPRIRTYGWDDSDLYKRLAAAGLRRGLFPENVLRHLDHSDFARNNVGKLGSDHAENLKLSIQANRVVSELDFPWKGTEDLKLAKKNQEGKGIWPSLSGEERVIFALRESSSRRYAKNSFAFLKKRVGLADLTARQAVLVRLEGGLGNRLSALASGFELAQRLGRSIVPVWVPDAACQARMRDLFHWGGGVVESEEELEIVSKESGAMSIDWAFRVLQRLERQAKGSTKSFYLKPQGVFDTQFLGWRGRTNLFLKRLVPSAQVQDHIKKIRYDFLLGVHITKEGCSDSGCSSCGWSFDRDATDSGELRRHGESAVVGKIVERIEFARRQLASERDLTVFVSADRIGEKERLLAHLGEAGRSLAGKPNGAAPESVQRALAELYALSHARHILAYNHSASMEIAIRLGSGEQSREVVGYCRSQQEKS